MAAGSDEKYKKIRFIKISPNTINLSMRLWGINPTNSKTFQLFRKFPGLSRQNCLTIYVLTEISGISLGLMLKFH